MTEAIVARPVRGLATVVEPAAEAAPEGGWRDSIRAGLLHFGVYRAVTLVVIVVGGLGSQFAHLLVHNPALVGGLFHHYDAVWFTDIADDGYTSEGLTAFPPGYPLLIRGVESVLRVNAMVAAVLVSSICLAGALVLLHKLVAERWGGAVAATTLFLLLLWPGSVFLTLAYADAPFLLLVVGGFWAAQRRRWWLAGLLIGLSCTMKVYGALFTLAIGWEYMEARGWSWRSIRADALLIVAPSAALIGGWMLYLQHRFGQPFLFLTIQKQWGKRLSFPWGGIEQGILNVSTSPERIVMSLDLLGIALIAIAAPIVFFKVRRSWGVMLALSFLAFTTTHDITSVGRHLTACFPLFVLAAILAQRAPRLTERLIAPLAALASGTLLIAFAQDHWAG
jgi:Mannosyltransferase (PIG-V)